MVDPTHFSNTASFSRWKMQTLYLVFIQWTNHVSKNPSRISRTFDSVSHNSINTWTTLSVPSATFPISLLWRYNHFSWESVFSLLICWRESTFCKLVLLLFSFRPLFPRFYISQTLLLVRESCILYWSIRKAMIDMRDINEPNADGCYTNFNRIELKIWPEMDFTDDAVRLTAWQKIVLGVISSSRWVFMRLLTKWGSKHVQQ